MKKLLKYWQDNKHKELTLEQWLGTLNKNRFKSFFQELKMQEAKSFPQLPQVMRTKSFQDYIANRLSKEEIIEIETQVELEIKILKAMQKAVADATQSYMKEHGVSGGALMQLFDDPLAAMKMGKGEANLTLAALAHFSVLMGLEPQLIFKGRKELG